MFRDAARRELSVPEAAELLKESLIERLGFEAVETKLLRGEFEKIVIAIVMMQDGSETGA